MLTWNLWITWKPKKSYSISFLPLTAHWDLRTSWCCIRSVCCLSSYKIGWYRDKQQNKHGDGRTCSTEIIKQIRNIPGYINNQQIREDSRLGTIKSEMKRRYKILVDDSFRWTQLIVKLKMNDPELFVILDVTKILLFIFHSYPLN